MNCHLTTAVLLGSLVAANSLAQVPDQRVLYQLEGDSFLDQTGAAVAAYGDFDGDGFADFLLGSPAEYSRSRGRVEMISGATGRVLLEIEGDPAGVAASTRFGASLAVIGDLDGDGAAEFAVGSPGDDGGGNDAGLVRVFGGDGQVWASLQGEFEDLGLGYQLCTPGDLDGDGLGELVVSTEFGDSVRAIGGAWLLDSFNGTLGTSSPVLQSWTGPASFGASLIATGDLNGDGVGDFAAGAPQAPGGGAVRVLSGGSFGVLFELGRGLDGDESGFALARIPDLNGDGVDELALGEPGVGFRASAVPNSGRVRVLSGTAVGQGQTSVLLELLAESPELRFGAALGSAGDLDGDGFGDLIVGATAAASMTELPRALVLSGASGAELLRFTAETEGTLGATVGEVGDLNNDGYTEFVVSETRTVSTSAGRASVLSGARLALTSDRHVLPLETGGTALLSLDAGADSAGFAYVLAGTRSGTAPGVPLPAGLVPINVDSYTVYSLGIHPELVAFKGVLDAAGRGQAQVSVGPGLPAGLLAWQLHYAFVTVDVGTFGAPVVDVSNAVALSFEKETCLALEGDLDCNGNGVQDACDLAEGTSIDCNGNGIPDECDIASGLSLDLDGDGTPDECTTVVYVDAQAQGSNNGSSWSDAYRDLRQALQQAPVDAQVWVAQGLYLPDQGSQLREEHFPMRPRVGIYGGFAGGETDLSQRSPKVFETILSGDLAGDDETTGNRLDNAWSVVRADQPVDRSGVLDGFTIRGGNANRTGDCDIWAVYFAACQGGGLYALGSPTVRNCHFDENYGGHNGGGIYAIASPLVTNCLFTTNGAFAGGAIYADIGCTLVAMDVEFRGNEALEGGAVFATGGTGQGPDIVNGLFAGNRATFTGGGLYLEGASTRLSSCTLAGNGSDAVGGGIWAAPGAELQMWNTILWDNVQLQPGSGIALQLSGGQVESYSCSIQGWDGSLDGNQTDAVPPGFIDPLGPDGLPRTGDEDLRLGPGSACLDRGNSNFLFPDVTDQDMDGNVTEKTPFDLLGLPRAVDLGGVPNTGVANGAGQVVDLGAYERQP